MATTYTPATIIKGEELMLFDADGHSIAYATNHTLTITGETQDISSKDHGQYGATSVNKITWEITSENLYTDGAFDTLYTSMTGRAAITVYFGHHTSVTGTPADGDIAYWSQLAGQTYTGKAYITSLTVNANNGENATFSITLTGAGAFTKTTTV